VDYTKLELDQIPSELNKTLADVRSTFTPLNAKQLNWRPDATSWSVGQCLEHLVQSNRELCAAFERAADPARPRTLWQRLPILPGFFGRMLVSTQGPKVGRKFVAPRQSTPSASDIDSGILDRFAAGHEQVQTIVRRVAGRDLSRMILVSPFVSFITYSVLDGLRLIVAHERRHIEQAKRVMQSPGFPSGGRQKSEDRSQK
jgi:hypothetical protein